MATSSWSSSLPPPLHPAVNVVGFEHEPRSDDERAAVTAAKKLLANGRALFTLPKEARCQFEKTALKDPQWETKDDTPGQPEAPGQHADYEARFTYQCWSPVHLTWLEPSLLDKLRNVTEARLNITTPRGATKRGRDQRPRPHNTAVEPHDALRDTAGGGGILLEGPTDGSST